MNVYEDKINCCGCTSCYNVCPRNAIKMVEDKEGFFYPVIDENRCINCGMCRRVCPLKKQPKASTESQKIYGIKNSNIERAKSSSGAMFAALCKYIIENNGVVFGASFSENFEVIHSYAESLEECEGFRGSKYVQSNLGDCFQKVVFFLRNNRLVLFSGTPCQCDGLKRYLGEKKIDSDKLVICDLICHGVPSPKVWKDYLSIIQSKESIISYKFREKKYGWHGDNISVTYKRGKKCVNTPKLKLFTNFYFGNYITRNCCEKCPYTNFNRISDITIGDFWGIEKANPSFDDNKGVSLVLSNTEKGNSIIKKLLCDLEWFETNQNDCSQEQLSHPYIPASNRADFWEDYENNGIIYVGKKYAQYNFKGKFIRHLKNIIKRLII